MEVNKKVNLSFLIMVGLSELIPPIFACYAQKYFLNFENRVLSS